MTKPLKLDDLARAMWEENLQIIPDGLCEPWDEETDALRNDWRSFTRAILTTIKEAGWKIVPVEATEEMLAAAWIARSECEEGTTPGIVFSRAYAAMQSAAPKIEGE